MVWRPILAPLAILLNMLLLHASPYHELGNSLLRCLIFARSMLLVLIVFVRQIRIDNLREHILNNGPLRLSPDQDSTVLGLASI